MSLSPQFLHYNATDSVCTLEAHNAFWPDLKNGFEPAYQMTVDIFPVLLFMQSRGIKVDFQALEVTRKDILASASTKQAELDLLVGRPLNVNSSKECQAYFYIELGIAPYYNEGKVTVDDTALQRLARGTARRAGLRQAKLVQDIRGLQKLHSTYLSMEFDADGRFRSSYNPRGCLLPETEVLTKNGWISLDIFQQGSEALQWNTNGDLTWGIPNKVEYDVEETLIECSSEQHQCIYTMDHRVPTYTPNTNKFEVRKAKDAASTYRQLPVSGWLKDKEAKRLLSLIRVIVMVQADGCVSEGNIILNFKNKRKADRCIELLEDAGLSYTTPKGNPDYYRYSIRRIDSAHIIGLIGKDKLFGSWLLALDEDTLDAFLDEIKYWDASEGKNHIRYNNKHKSNVTWVATIAHLRGKKAHVSYAPGGYCPLWRVSIIDDTRVSLKEHYW